MNTYILCNHLHPNTLIMANSELDACNQLARRLNYKNYQEMLDRKGVHLAKVDIELLYKTPNYKGVPRHEQQITRFKRRHNRPTLH